MSEALGVLLGLCLLGLLAGIEEEIRRAKRARRQRWFTAGLRVWWRNISRDFLAIFDERKRKVTREPEDDWPPERKNMDN